jgi:hypothetical protein
MGDKCLSTFVHTPAMETGAIHCAAAALDVSMSVITAIVTPETNDCALPGKLAFDWFNQSVITDAASTFCCQW